jgi:hypothetical protein
MILDSLEGGGVGGGATTVTALIMKVLREGIGVGALVVGLDVGLVVVASVG